MNQPTAVTQPGQKRIRNFNEVALGFSKKITLEESRRCPQCANPVCMKGCPLGINIPGFIRQLREGNWDEAQAQIKEESWLPAVCGRICSAPCEVACILNEEEAPIAIRTLERFASDYGRNHSAKFKKNLLSFVQPSALNIGKQSEILPVLADRPGASTMRTVKQMPITKDKKIAIVGAGPAGLTAAAQLAKKGYPVTILESQDKPGGVLRYGIPEFRLPKKILDQEIEEICRLGVEIKTNFFIGQTLSLQDVFKQGFAVVLLATGAGRPKFMDLPGSHFGGVYYGEEFLMRVNARGKAPATFPIGQKIVVIGSGNTALDCARLALRLGRHVTLMFRRTEEEMKVRFEERQYGKEEGVCFEPLLKPLEILANTRRFVSGLKCIRMDYADSEEKGNWELIPVPDSEFILETDTVIIAVGHEPNALQALRGDISLKLKEDGSIWVDEQTGMTSHPGIFACGNVATNAGPVVEAMASGKRVAEQIEQYLK